MALKHFEFSQYRPLSSEFAKSAYRRSFDYRFLPIFDPYLTLRVVYREYIIIMSYYGNQDGQREPNDAPFKARDHGPRDRHDPMGVDEHGNEARKLKRKACDYHTPAVIDVENRLMRTACGGSADNSTYQVRTAFLFVDSFFCSFRPFFLTPAPPLPPSSLPSSTEYFQYQCSHGPSCFQLPPPRMASFGTLLANPSSQTPRLFTTRTKLRI